MAEKNEPTVTPTDPAPKDPAPQYPDDLKDLLKKHEASLNEVVKQRDTLADELKAQAKTIGELQTQIVELAKKPKDDPKPPSPKEDEILRIAEEKFNEKLSEALKARDSELADLKTRLARADLDTARNRIIQQSGGRIVASLLDDAATPEDLERRAVLAKSEYERLAKEIESKLVAPSFPDPSAGHNPANNEPPDTTTPPKKTDIAAEVATFLQANGPNPTQYTPDTLKEWKALKQRAHEEAGLA